MRINTRAARIGLAVVGGLGIIGASVVVASARGGGGDTAKVSYVAGACNWGDATQTAAMAMLSQSGPHAQFGFGASGPEAAGDWTVLVTDTNDKGESATFGSDAAGVGTAWSTFLNFDMLKGKNAIAISAANGAVHCDAMLFAKV